MTTPVTRIDGNGTTSPMSFAPIQREVDEWISRFEEGYFPPLAMLARVTEEVGELARALAHRYGGKKPKSGEAVATSARRSPAIFVLVCLANSQKIDLDDAFAKLMNQYRERDAHRWTKKT